MCSFNGTQQTRHNRHPQQTAKNWHRWLCRRPYKLCQIWCKPPDGWLLCQLAKYNKNVIDLFSTSQGRRSRGGTCAVKIRSKIVRNEIDATKKDAWDCRFHHHTCASITIKWLKLLEYVSGVSTCIPIVKIFAVCDLSPLTSCINSLYKLQYFMFTY